MADEVDYGWFIFLGFMVLVLIGALTMIVSLTYDTFYIEPLAADAANTYCMTQGFDQYKSFSRVGLFSEVPVGIKCEYAEKYTDLGIRSN